MRTVYLGEVVEPGRSLREWLCAKQRIVPAWSDRSLGGAPTIAAGQAAQRPDAYVDILRPPDLATAFLENETIKLARDGRRWTAKGIAVEAEPNGSRNTFLSGLVESLVTGGAGQQEVIQRGWLDDFPGTKVFNIKVLALPAANLTAAVCSRVELPLDGSRCFAAH